MRFRAIFVLFVVMAGFLSPPTLTLPHLWGAQEKDKLPRLEPARGRLPVDETADALKKRFDTGAPTFGALLRGEQQANEADNAQMLVIDTASKYYAYRLTWAEKQKKPGDLDSLVRDFDIQVIQPAVKAKSVNQRFLELFAKQMVLHLKEVLQNNKPAVVVNGARLLAKLGKTGVEDVGKALVEILGDKNQKGYVIVYALQGMKDLFAFGRPKDPALEAQWIQTLLDYVSRRPAFPVNTPPDEAAAFLYLRREAIRALGETRLPATAKGQTALLLLRIARRDKDGVVPGPTLSEQVEAAIGVCQLQSKLLAGVYQLDYAAFSIGEFISDFAAKWNKDLANNPMRLSEGWRLFSARLRVALDTFKTESQDKYVADLVAEADKVLQLIDTATPKPADPKNLDAWLKKNAAKSSSLYKGDEKAKVTAQPD